jgi:glycerol-3-phosphate acyltransferase PlsX
MSLSIAVDAMGGDAGPAVTLPATRLFLENHPLFKINLFGPVALLEPWMDCLPPLVTKRVQIFHAPEIIENTLSSKEAVRRKNSSMRLAIESVKSGQSQAIVSGGHTGALMALSKILLSTLPGISRPAIAKALPIFHQGAYRKHIVMLDLGANVECTSQNLFEFAILGDALVRCLRESHEKPIIKLLNIGVEEKKGHQYIRDTAFLLSRSSLRYEGFLEPHEIFHGVADVIVTDGFSGNIAIKTAEGVARLFKDNLKIAFSSSWSSIFGALFVRGALSERFRHIDPAHHNGAFILGLNGIVIKSHGNSEIMGFLRAIDFAASQVESDILEKIQYNMNLIEQDSFDIKTDLH